MPRGTTITTTATGRALWASLLHIFTGLEKTQTRRRLLFASASFQILAFALIIWLNVGVLGKDTCYLLGVRPPSLPPNHRSN